ncbi:MAG: hypothetical protein K940chlam9_01547 [Chlamydiae bacterium]|nr:hypothetical protein [Chlamydiota bacterium]
MGVGAPVGVILLAAGIISLVKDLTISKSIDPIYEVNDKESVEVGDLKSFGKAEWKLYFGIEVEDAPPLPDNIEEILNQNCPIFGDGEKVHETHILVLIPASVTIESLGELVQNPQNGGHSSKYASLNLPDELKQKAGEKSYWVLMTKDVLPDTREIGLTSNYLFQNTKEKTYEERKNKVVKHTGYKVYKSREAAICLFVHHVTTGEYLYGRNPLSYACCEEQVEGMYPIDVGDFGPEGLQLRYRTRNLASYVRYGMGALRRFF